MTESGEVKSAEEYPRIAAEVGVGCGGGVALSGAGHRALHDLYVTQLKALPLCLRLSPPLIHTCPRCHAPCLIYKRTASKLKRHSMQ